MACWLNMLESFYEICKNTVLGSKIRFSAQMSNNAKNAMKHSENTTKTCLEVLKNVLKRLFLVQKSGSRLRCRTMLKKTWNAQKTPTKHVLRLFKKFLKIWFSAQLSNNAKENTNKTCFEAFWEILENPVLGSKIWFSALISNYAKIPWNTPTIHVLSLFNKFLKIRFSAQKSGSRPRCRTMLKKIWNTQKTPTKHPLGHFKKFLKIRFLAEKSGSRLRCRIMLKYHETVRKHQLNMFRGFLRNSWKSGSRLKNPFLGLDFELC